MKDNERKLFVPAHILHFDGCCWPNPRGPMGMGWHLDGADGKKILEGCHRVTSGPGNTNNVAEYFAMLLGMRAILNLGLGDDPLLIRGDSTFVIEQTSRDYYAINDHLPYAYYAHLAREWKVLFSSVRFEWIPREKNERADLLSRKMML